MYSMGSSTVRMLREWLFSSCNPAYSVVLLPEPVGPVTRKMPCGLCNSWRNCAVSSRLKPRRSSVRRAWFLSSSRSTTRSPQAEGMVETRTSIARPPSSSAIRPSCGTRFSAMSSRAITLIRDTSSEASLRPGRSISCNVPSTRKRITRLFSNVSMWISEAPSLIASASMALISLMIGASSSLSSRSSVSGSSSARVKKSSAEPRSSISWRASEESRCQTAFSRCSNSASSICRSVKGAFSPRCSSCKTESDSG